VGIPPLKKHYTEEELIWEIETQIEQSDIVFAIATKRDQMLNTLRWRTFEWLQSEAAIAHVKNKPVLVFVERGVELSGFANLRTVGSLLSPRDLSCIDAYFDKNMPQNRDMIAQRRKTKFWDGVLGGVTIVGSLALVALGGYFLGKADTEEWD